MTFQAFYISVAVLLAAVFCGAVIVWILESRFQKKHPANQNEQEVEERSVNVTGEKVYLEVVNGTVTVIDELPTVEVNVGEPQIIERIVEVPVPVAGQAVAEAIVDESEEEEAPIEEDEEEDNANLVTFERSEAAQRLTFADKLAALPREDLERYHKLVNYVLAKDNAKHVITNNMAIFKIRTARMMVATVKRGVVTLQFSVNNSEFERFVRDEKKHIKVPPITIRLVDDDSLEDAKRTADITVSHIEAERDYLREQKRAQRREQRAKAREAAAAAAAADSTDNN